MIISRHDEEKRSRIWRMGFTVSSILIVVIAIYLLIKLFTDNPLDGNWVDEDGNYGLRIQNNGSMVVSIPDLAEDTDVDVKMAYTIDKDAKTITIFHDEEEMKEVVEESDGQYTIEMLENSLSSITTTFNYSVDQDELTLTEREYGEQMIFIKE